MRILGLALLLAAASGFAQLAPVEPASVAVPALPWSAVGGYASALSVAADGAVFAIDPQGSVWLRRPGDNPSWSSIPGAFRRIAAVSQRKAWAVDAQGALYLYNGTWWRPLDVAVAVEDLAASGAGRLYLVARDGRLLWLDERRGVQALEQAPAGLRRVALDGAGLPWVLDQEQRIQRFDGKVWQTLAVPRAREIAVGDSGAWAVTPDGQLLQLEAGGVPRQIAQDVSVIALAADGLPWIARGDGRIYARSPRTEPRRAAPRYDVQVFGELLNWQPVNGQARQLVISPGGAVLALGRAGEVWQWKIDHQWGRLPGTFARLALDADNVPWGTLADGRILSYQGSYWREMPGSASDIAGGADGSLWILQDNGTPARWKPRVRTWEALPTSDKLRRLAVGPDGEPWALTEAGGVLRHTDEGWQALPEVEAADLAVGPEGSVFVVGTDQQLLRLDAPGKRWERLNLQSSAASVAVGPGGRPWITTPEARILASAFFDDSPDSQVETQSLAARNAQDNAVRMADRGAAVVGQPGVGDGAPRGNPRDPLEYRKVTGKARDVAIGADGSVFIIAFDGTLALWSNLRNAFVAFPGKLARLAVAPDGKPWGVTASGDVFRHDGTAWQQVLNIKAQDVAVGYDGTVLIVDEQSFLQRYDAPSATFARLPGNTDGVLPTGRRVAVTPAGQPWVIDADGFVARCDKKATCERLPFKARSLDIGPEGSVLIVDSERILRRWNERAEDFERIDSIPDLVDLVAVGPRGKPWLLSTVSEVWAAEFFPRDERQDLTTAASTEALIGGSVAQSSFKFTVNMPFDKLRGLMAPFVIVPETATLQMAINPVSGQAVLIDADNHFFNYAEVGRTLLRDATIPAAPFDDEQVRSFVIARDGSYWVSTGAAWSAEVWHYQAGRWSEVSGAWSSYSMWMPIQLAEAPDGKLYASGPDEQLYRYEPAARRFVKVTMALPNGRINSLAIAPDGHFWVGSTGFGLYEQIGGSWQLRRAESGFLDDCQMDGFTCFAVGPDGSAYLVDVYGAGGSLQLQRWNAGARSWDVLGGSPELGDRGVYAVGSDGRPWAAARSSLDAFAGELYRAR